MSLETLRVRRMSLPSAAEMDGSMKLCVVPVSRSDDVTALPPRTKRAHTHDEE